MGPEPGAMRIASQQVITGLDYYLTAKYQFAKILAQSAETLFDIAPRSFVFPDDFDTWRTAATNEPQTIWISKPGNGARGEGISLVGDIAAVQPVRDQVLQEYISNPHLIDGYKYTLRFYVAVTSLDPLRVYVFPDGLAKLATQPYSTDPALYSNLFIHLTNPDILRNDTSVDIAKHRMSHKAYRARLRKDGHDDMQLFKDIRTLIAKSLLAVREPSLHLQQQNAASGIDFGSQYMLIGYDILVDETMRPWILEANAGPSLEVEVGTSKSIQNERNMKQQIATDMLVLAGLLPKVRVRFEPLFPSAAMLDWLPCYEVVRDNDAADLKQYS